MSKVVTGEVNNLVEMKRQELGVQTRCGDWLETQATRFQPEWANLNWR